MSSKNKNSDSSTPTVQGQAAEHKPQQVTRQIQQYSGPIPPPEILGRYNEIIPDAAERILSMAEKDSEHLRQIEMAALQAAKDQHRIGQLLGFGIGLAALGASITALFLGYEEAATVLGGSTVLGLVAVFVTGRVLASKKN